MTTSDAGDQGAGNAPRCPSCGEPGSYARLRFEIPVSGSLLVADEVPSLTCASCGHSEPAAHARPYVEAVIAVVEDEPARAHKDFSTVPLRPDGA